MAYLQGLAQTVDRRRGGASQVRIMILEPDDAERFFKLHKALTLFVNQRLKIAKPPAKSEGIVALPPKQRLKVRDALVEHLGLIDAFVEENPYKLEPDDLEIVK